ncbi:TetR family transcriptional regulator [Sediminibacillus dalangtanensis]|uniref:TetR family transcriptional regulator n=1 Tax=Sediminibacillus dalangtanensis TaxID=2729421 RepID=A0ABX7VTU8_9BACI|nr:TetR/AcrR family transcriptional regulator [Sediminibacillus dalangtanensis]QTN00305.1 TetR family transcriptional regulator [Sediminibacillus dalangtanensis]
MANERKRGEELEIAILEAADEIIKMKGYWSLTFQNVAKQAKTSRTVIYRRYETPFEILHALVKYKSKQAFDGPMIDLLKDKGSLREDLIAVMELFQQLFRKVGLGVLDAMLFELRQGNEESLLWLNQAHESNIKVMKKVQGFAMRRGEIKHEFSRMQMILPFNILRMENLMNGKKLTKEYIIQLVDEVLMPMYTKET